MTRKSHTTIVRHPSEGPKLSTSIATTKQHHAQINELLQRIVQNHRGHRPQRHVNLGKYSSNWRAVTNLPKFAQVEHLWSERSFICRRVEAHECPHQQVVVPELPFLFKTGDRQVVHSASSTKYRLDPLHFGHQHRFVWHDSSNQSQSYASVVSTDDSRSLKFIFKPTLAKNATQQKVCIHQAPPPPKTRKLCSQQGIQPYILPSPPMPVSMNSPTPSLESMPTSSQSSLPSFFEIMQDHSKSLWDLYKDDDAENALICIEKFMTNQYS